MTMRLVRTISLVVLLAGCGVAAQVQEIVLAPVADHHAHLRSFAVDALFLDPQSFGGTGSYAHVAGSFGRVADPPPGDRGKFLLVLEKAANGSWRIAAATLQDRPPDTSSGPSVPTRAPWALFRTLPLTEAEFQTVATNLAPYMRRRSQ